MLGTPTQCPSCAAVVSPFDACCPACRQVLGPDNICDRCQALAPTISRHGRLLCSACESERTRRPHTVVVRDRQTRWALAWERFRRKILTAIAAFIAVSNGTCGGLLVRYSGGQDLIQILGATLLLAAALVPILLFLWDKRARNRSKARERFTLQQRLVGLAYKRGGVLTADDVARSLNIPVSAADAMLDQLVHQQKAEIEVTERGEIQFLIGPARLPASTASGASSTPQGAAARAARRGTESA